MVYDRLWRFHTQRGFVRGEGCLEWFYWNARWKCLLRNLLFLVLSLFGDDLFGARFDFFSFSGMQYDISFRDWNGCNDNFGKNNRESHILFLINDVEMYFSNFCRETLPHGWQTEMKLAHFWQMCLETLSLASSALYCDWPFHPGQVFVPFATSRVYQSGTMRFLNGR